jgi:hypothetical protein
VSGDRILAGEQQRDLRQRVARGLAAPDGTTGRRSPAGRLHLISLGNEPRPEGSRALEPLGPPVPGARIWAYPPFEILYRVDDAARRVSVGQVTLEGTRGEPPG